MPILAIGIAGALLFFVVQLILCLYVKRTAVKLIPIYVVLFCMLIMAADFAGMIDYHGYFNGTGILGLMGFFIVGISLIGEVLAWVVYAIRMKTQVK